jgi:ubiquinone/menaquinone biosynthesis C-methylase UbiE
MTLADVVAFVGHRIHVVRGREVDTLFSWATPLRGKRLLDVAGGDGWWAGRAARLGARATALDIDGGKLVRGRTYAGAPALVRGDALKLPFADSSFDVVMSVCAIEHFADGGAAVDEMARVLAPGGTLVLSADTLSRERSFPSQAERHKRRYHVVRSYDHAALEALMKERGLTVLEHRYLFKGERAEQLYFSLSRWKVGWNLAAPLAPLVARSDRRNDDEAGSVVCVRARKD